MSNSMKEFLYYNKRIIALLLIVLLTLIIFILNINNNEYSSKENDEIIKEEYTATKTNNKTIYVDVKGNVKKPGVYEMNENDRVIDVLKKSGLTKNSNTRYINLSKKVTDEMVIVVYSNKEVNNFLKAKSTTSICTLMVNNACITNYTNKSIDSVITDNSNTSIEANLNTSSNDITKSESTTTSTKNSIININTASVKELTTLSGIGSSKATSIIEYRNSNGKFTSIEDIKNVSGIGDSIFEKIKNNITV